ncbi:MAG: UbiH/UbiF/VisC/COQ6 family ubiquinone biosynthesis hydroxylase [Motiliproteus sp.]|nr:UbiH/UbiF/VisC/COQ6 family ubiquinone biosynthesis hydroxylase [Motiliproteus sp.]MCW9051368.1 UbiH/UbiF/VisC/COQ6 family ubiquinone biosynthesis hydroxylase [Motiliproteus sp.]
MVKQKAPEIVDVAIVGGGLVGLTLACALGGSGFRVAVIEPQPREPEAYWQRVLKQNDEGYDPRVSALTLASEQILRNLGAWDYMEQLRLCPYRHMHVWDGEGTAEIDFNAADMYEPYLGHIIENRVTLASLYQVMEKHPNLQLIQGVSLKGMSEPHLADDGDFSLRYLQLSDDSELQARLVVAADGARSQTRRLAGLTINEWDYQHHAIVTTVTSERSHQFTAWQRFTEDGPLALLPLAGDDDNTTSIVWSTSPDHARELMAMDEEAFKGALTQTFEERLGRILTTDERFCFPLIQRHAASYVEEGVALVGDAAHTIHPLAGQGVNLGFLDAATLAEELLHAEEVGADFGDKRWLRRYQRRRQGENLRMMGLMGAFRHLYGEVPPPLHWLRNSGMNVVNRVEPLKRFFAGRAMGLESGRPELAQRPVVT